MHTSPNIPPSDLLLAYLAGELDDVQETLLFRRLLENTELRTELRDYLVIDSIVRRDSDTISPPARLKNSTLNAVAALRREPEHFTPIAPLWTLPRVVGLAVLSAFLGGVLALVLMQPAREQQIAERIPAATGNSAAQQTMPTTTAPDRQLTVDAAAREQRPAQLSATTGSSFTQPSVSIPDPAHEAQTKERVATSHAHMLSAQENIDLSLPVQRTELLPSVDARSLFDLSGSPLGLRAEVRGTAMQALQTTDMPSQSDPWFNNMSAGLALDLSDHHSIGVEVGQEAFTQVYSGTENGRRAMYEQKPVLLWAGGMYQYTFDGIDKFGGVRPFVRAVAGGTKIGPITRGIAGIQYTPDARVSLWLGAEGSLLMYRFQNTWFSSHKLGVSYGMSILW